MTKQLKTIEILNPSKSATCSMWRYPESAKIFQYRGMDFDGFRVVRVKLGNPNSRDNKGSWRILKDFYCSVTMLRELVRVNEVMVKRN